MATQMTVDASWPPARSVPLLINRDSVRSCLAFDPISSLRMTGMIREIYARGRLTTRLH